MVAAGQVGFRVEEEDRLGETENRTEELDHFLHTQSVSHAYIYSHHGLGHARLQSHTLTRPKSRHVLWHLLSPLCYLTQVSDTPQLENLPLSRWILLGSDVKEPRSLPVAASGDRLDQRMCSCTTALLPHFTMR